MEINNRLLTLNKQLFVETNPAPGKWVLEQLGLIESGFVRPPLITPTDAGIDKIKTLMAAGQQYLSPVDGFMIGGK